MAMRALSCTKNGYRKFYARDRRPEYVEQPPQVLGDIHGVFAPYVVGASLAVECCLKSFLCGFKQ